MPITYTACYENKKYWRTPKINSFVFNSLNAKVAFIWKTVN